MRSTQPTSSPHTPSSPVSSSSSRTTASASISPVSTRPPGTDHSPAAGPRPRRIRSRQSLSTATAPTQTSGLGIGVVEPFVHHEQPGGEARRLEEVLGGPGPGQGGGVGAHAALLAEPVEQQLHHRLPYAHAPGALLDEQLVD